jgi:hypothetical protein
MLYALPFLVHYAYRVCASRHVRRMTRKIEEYKKYNDEFAAFPTAIFWFSTNCIVFRGGLNLDCLNDCKQKEIDAITLHCSRLKNLGNLATAFFRLSTKDIGRSREGDGSGCCFMNRL